jgi:hypothetical protein
MLIEPSMLRLNYVAPERAYWEYSAELEIFQIASTWFYMERELFK